MAQLQVNALEERLGTYLGSQRAFLSFPQPHLIDPTKPRKVFMKVTCGGWGSGKSYSGIVNGLLLSAMFPGNEGLIGRFHGKDLEDSLIPLFFQICPESWIARCQNRGKTGMTVRLVNGSIIYFRHIHDAGGNATKSRRVGANLGWFFLSQIEELTEAHWQTLMGRLRNPKAGIKMGMGDANPNGRDWVQKQFFQNWKPLDPANGIFFRTYQKGNIFSVHVDSEENREINGGFIQDDYFDNLINNMDPAWVNRYIHGSFEDFSGKVYKGYTLDSVHNIDPIPIPSHWECTVGIDVGGSCPWGVVVAYSDENGNQIIHRTLSRATSRTLDIAEWIKSNCPWNESRTTFVIDPENKLAASELADYGIYCRVAQKQVHEGTLRVAGYFHVRKNAPLPRWFRETQSQQRIKLAEAGGVPRIFVVRGENVGWCREHDECVWDDKRTNQIKKTNDKRFDLCFAKGTQITMGDGSSKSIEDVKTGDFVLTRIGPKKVITAGLTGKNKEVLTVELSNGSSLIGTNAHNVWTVGNAWTPLDALRYGEVLLSCDQNPYFIGASNLNYSKTNRTTVRDPHGVGILGWITNRGAVNGAARHLSATSMLENGFADDSVRVITRVPCVSRADVYNITVQEQPEYYANGVLVHNCDSTRYLVMTRPEASVLPQNDDPYSELRKVSLAAAREMEATDREIAQMKQEQEGRGSREMFEDQDYGYNGDTGLWTPRHSSAFDWN